jgi:hypothetical protein
MARRLIPVLTLLGVVVVWGCSSKQETEQPVEPITHPLPTAGLAGEPVTVYPLTLIVAEPRLRWDSLIRPRDEALQRADSLIELFLEERAPEADWVMPAELSPTPNRWVRPCCGRTASRRSPIPCGARCAT